MPRKKHRSNQARRTTRITTTHVIITFLVLVAAFWIYTVLSYWIFQKEMTIMVVDKRTEETRYQECVSFDPESGCRRHRTVTNTLYFIVTSSEDFDIEAELYDEIETGRTYRVLVSGWAGSILPRRITEIY